jgi:hypothetical protein
MSALVVAFPCHRESAHQDVPPDPPSAQVIRFPSASDSLTKLDLEALAALTSAARCEWRCETERDGNWGLSAILVPSKPEGHDYAAFLVCRSNSKLLLIDARLSAGWRRLGVFDDTQALALALAEIIGTTQLRRNDRRNQFGGWSSRSP